MSRDRPSGTDPDDPAADDDPSSRRPEGWVRVSSDRLSVPDLDAVPLPDRADLERIPAEEFYDS